MTLAVAEALNPNKPNPEEIRTLFYEQHSQTQDLLNTIHCTSMNGEEHGLYVHKYQQDRDIIYKIHMYLYKVVFTLVRCCVKSRLNVKLRNDLFSPIFASLHYTIHYKQTCVYILCSYTVTPRVSLQVVATPLTDRRTGICLS